MWNSNHCFVREDIKEGGRRLIRRWVDSFKEYAWSNQVEVLVIQRRLRVKKMLCVWKPPASWLFSRLVVSNSLWPHGLLHTRLPCPSQSPEVCPSSCPLHRWCYPASSSSDTRLSFCPQSFPVSGTFPMSQLFTSDDQNTGFSLSISPSIEYSRLISFMIVWLDLLIVQGKKLVVTR